jgi:DNA-directed RNA polymerase specialized sigma24 family protein
LPAAKRAVIVLHDLEELPLKETAVIVNSNERTVRSRLIDGRKKLARLLAEDPLFDVEDDRGRK